jgi:hypothetical protein
VLVKTFQKSSAISKVSEYNLMALEIYFSLKAVQCFFAVGAVSIGLNIS